MVARKRNKIVLPPTSTGNENRSNVNKLNKVKISLLEEEDEDISPIALVKKKNSKSVVIKKNQHEDTCSSTPDYKGLFKGNSKMKILNLDDMTDDDDDDDENTTGTSIIPSKTEIEALKRGKERANRPADRKWAIREKDYVSLLDTEDKLDIIDTIKKHGGTGKESEVWVDREVPNEAEEEKLVLGEKASLLHEQQKKKMIEDALNEQQTDATKEWESQLLMKGSGSNTAKIRDEPSLPKLYSFEQEDIRDELAVRLNTIQKQKKQLLVQLDILKRERVSLNDKKNLVLNKLV